MRLLRSVSIINAMLLTSGFAGAGAQHAGHDMSAMSADTAAHPSSRLHVMVQAIPLVTRADPSAGGAPVTQAVLSQVVAMLRGSFADGHGALAAALDAEGITMPNGELNTGGYGEGFVDRRHPHTYIHELMVSGLGQTGPVNWSASAGRGFAPFGTDDPMMRPIVKFPINHHLAQILERATIIGAARVGPIVVEGATFGGDEPSYPSSLPRASRFGDSWSVRATMIPVAGLELQASHARVASPEESSGIGLDQRKQSVSARAIAPDGGRYLLVEWERTTERDAVRMRDVFGYGSALAECAVRTGPFGLALRLEQSERPEEDRLAEPFRTPRPSTDLSINGLTRWRTVTLHVSGPAQVHGSLAGSPFIELADLSAEPRNPQSLFTPERLYGTSRFVMLTAGIRLRIGGAHARMGRYGVADINGPAIRSMTGGVTEHQH
jgi:hypothetical protein